MRQETMGLWDGSGISWTISSKMSEMNSTLSLNFYRLNALPEGHLTMKAGTILNKITKIIPRPMLPLMKYVQ